jgi:hypothetical protein
VQRHGPVFSEHFFELASAEACQGGGHSVSVAAAAVSYFTPVFDDDIPEQFFLMKGTVDDVFADFKKSGDEG